MSNILDFVACGRADKAKNKQVYFRHFSFRPQQTRVDEKAYEVEKKDVTSKTRKKIGGINKTKEVNGNNVKNK
jgi:hypothetical protein